MRVCASRDPHDNGLDRICYPLVPDPAPNAKPPGGKPDLHTMPMPPVDTRALAQSGAAALRRGDARTARESFERLIAAGPADASCYLALAYACRHLDDSAATLAAVDKALALEPRNLRALVLKADHLAESGDERGASSFY